MKRITLASGSDSESRIEFSECAPEFEGTRFLKWEPLANLPVQILDAIQERLTEEDD